MSARPIVSARPAPTPIVRLTPAKRAARKRRRDATPHHAVDRFSNALEPEIIPASCAFHDLTKSSGRPSRQRLACTSKTKIKDASTTARTKLDNAAFRSSAESSQTRKHHRRRDRPRAREPCRLVGMAPIFPPSVAKMRHFERGKHL